MNILIGDEWEYSLYLQVNYLKRHLLIIYTKLYFCLFNGGIFQMTYIYLALLPTSNRTWRAARRFRLQFCDKRMEHPVCELGWKRLMRLQISQKLSIVPNIKATKANPALGFLSSLHSLTLVSL